VPEEVLLQLLNLRHNIHDNVFDQMDDQQLHVLLIRLLAEVDEVADEDEAVVDDEVDDEGGDDHLDDELLLTTVLLEIHREVVLMENVHRDDERLVDEGVQVDERVQSEVLHEEDQMDEDQTDEHELHNVKRYEMYQTLLLIKNSMMRINMHFVFEVQQLMILQKLI